MSAKSVCTACYIKWLIHHHIEQILSEKIQSLLEPSVVGMKLNISSVMSVKTNSPSKIKSLLSNKCIETINEEVGRGKYKFNLNKFN